MKTQKQAENYEALISLVQMGIRKMNDVVYEVPSTTSGLHIVTVVENQVTFCSNCKGWATYHKCLHAIATIRFIQEESRTQAAPVAAQDVVEQAVEVVKVADSKQAVRGILGRSTVAEEQTATRRGYTTRRELTIVNGIPMR